MGVVILLLATIVICTLICLKADSGPLGESSEMKNKDIEEYLKGKGKS